MSRKEQKNLLPIAKLPNNLVFKEVPCISEEVSAERARNTQIILELTDTIIILNEKLRVQQEILESCLERSSKIKQLCNEFLSKFIDFCKSCEFDTEVEK